MRCENEGNAVLSGRCVGVFVPVDRSFRYMYTRVLVRLFVCLFVCLFVASRGLFFGFQVVVDKHYSRRGTM